MGEWKRVKLGEIADLCLGKMLDAKKNKGELRPYLNNVAVRWGGFDLNDLPEMRFEESEFERYSTRRNDIIACEGGEPGRCAIWESDEPIFLQKALHRIRVHDGCNPRFVYYQFCHLVKSGATQHLETGSTIRHLPGQAIREVELQLPPLPTQRRIAAVLGALDDKIEVNRKICENLEAQAQALFKAWFVDFEPFGGKCPEGWKEVSLLDVTELFDMKRVPLSSREREKRKGQFPYYGATSIMDYVNDYLFDGVYLLMGEDGSVAREDGVPYLQYISGQFWVNNHAHIMQGRNGYSTEMLWCVLSQTDISTFVTGAVQPKLSQTNMKMIKVPILTMDAMRRFGESVQPKFDLLRTKRAESRALAAMRDALLPKLMSGELAVEKVKDKICK